MWDGNYSSFSCSACSSYSYIIQTLIIISSEKKIEDIIHIEKYYQNKFIKKCTEYIYSQMSKKRGNLIDEIRARLGRMQLEKIRFI